MSICFNVICNVIDNISSSHFDNRKNNFLILGEGPTFRTNGSFASPEKKFSINFTKINTKFCLSLHYNAYNNSSKWWYLFVNEKAISKFEAEKKNVKFPTRFCLRSNSNGFSTTESTEVSLNGNGYDFLVDYNPIDTFDILIIQKFLMTKK